MASQEEVERLRHKLDKIHNTGVKAMKKAKCIAETNAAAFAGGFLHAYYKDEKGNGPNVYGIPLIPAAGLLALGAGLYTEASYAEDLINIGNGLTCAFSSMMGDQIGGKLKNKQPITPLTMGEGQSFSGGDSPQDIANMMAHASGLSKNTSLTS